MLSFFLSAAETPQDSNLESIKKLTRLQVLSDRWAALTAKTLADVLKHGSLLQTLVISKACVNEDVQTKISELIFKVVGLSCLTQLQELTMTNNSGGKKTFREVTT